MNKGIISLLILIVLTLSVPIYSIDWDIKLELTSVDSPMAAYTFSNNIDGTIIGKSQQDFEEKYFKEFSMHFFGSNRIIKKLDDSPGRAMKFYFIIKNTSDRAMTFNHLVCAFTCKEIKSFPWEKLPVTPHLEFRKDKLDFISDGVGPAMNVRWEVLLKSTGRVLIESSLWALEPNYRQYVLDGRIKIDMKKMKVFRGDLDYELYLKMANAPEDEYDPKFKECEGTWFEQIETVKRLQEVAESIYKNSIEIKCTYESLKGMEESHTFDTNLPKNIIFYKQNPLLSDYLPIKCNIHPIISRSENTHISDEPKVCTLIEQDFGINLVEKVVINAGDLQVGETDEKTISLQNSMPPGSEMVLIIRIDEPHNGLYTIDFKLDGEDICDFSIESIVPPFHYFNSYSHYKLFKPLVSSKEKKDE